MKGFLRKNMKKLDIFNEVDLQDIYSLLPQSVNLSRTLSELGLRRIHQNGSNLFALCPYHQERRSSWSICCDETSPKWGIHNCFACHASGNIVTLVRDLYAFNSYEQALFFLLNKNNVMDITEDELLDLSVMTRKRRKFKKIKKKSLTWVKSLPPVQPDDDAYQYLLGRNIPFSQIAQSGARLGVGRYEGRVIFPIFDINSRLVSFYARDITGKNTPKGLYPKGTGILKNVLYGINFVNLMEPTVYLVEGIFDVFAVKRSLVRLGLPSDNVFGVLKSSISESQAQLLAFCETVVVIPDMDGKSEGLVPSVKNELSFKNIMLAVPEVGHDPASLPDDQLDAILSEPISAYKTQVSVFSSYSLD